MSAWLCLIVMTFTFGAGIILISGGIMEKRHQSIVLGACFITASNTFIILMANLIFNRHLIKILTAG
jgi:hypothetical protein